jgi:hypothetical protein
MALGWVPRGRRLQSSDLMQDRRGDHRTVSALHATRATEEMVSSTSQRPQRQGPRHPHFAEATASDA